MHELPHYRRQLARGIAPKYEDGILTEQADVAESDPQASEGGRPALDGRVQRAWARGRLVVGADPGQPRR